MNPRWRLLLPLLFIFTFTALHAQRQEDPRLEILLRKYRDSLGGLANLERIRTVRLEGEIELPSGSSQKITVLKKKPNSVRITLQTGGNRFIQAYDGDVAWTMFERSGRTYIRIMEGDEKYEFVRTAPIENAFISPDSTNAVLSLGEDTTLNRLECHQLVATFEDGTQQVIAIDKEEFRDRRISFYDESGELVSEILPSRFENFGGIVFAMQVIRMVDGKAASTMRISQVDLNIGVLDSAFNYPLPNEP